MVVRRTAVAAVAAALLLAGCTDDPEPRFAPTESPSPSESATTATAEPEAQSAEDFIREWVELDNAMQTTGTTGPYLAVSFECDSCRDLARRVESVYKKGGSIETEGLRVTEIRRVSGPTYEIVARSAPTEVLNRDGSVAQQFDGGRVTYGVAIQHKSGEWGVQDWYEVAQ